MATWVGPPRSWTPGRPRPIQYIIIHATAGSEGPQSAEDGAAYDKRRTDGTSTHIFVDTNTAVREVHDEDQAHAARYHGNAIGLQVEICGQANQTSTQWADALSAPTLALAAKEVAAMCARWDIPVRRLTVTECRAAWYAPAGQRPKGIVGHVDVTAAYPEDAGTHTDPGPGFPWARFLEMIKAEQRGQTMAFSEQEERDIAFTLLNGGEGQAAHYRLQVIRGQLSELQADVTALLARPVGTVTLTGADRAAIVADLLAALAPEVRDAVADFGEGGAAQVRADA